MGDNSPEGGKHTFEMELWDTVTNEVKSVNHPPGFEAKRFLRPMISVFGENAILLTGSKVFSGTDEGTDHDGEIFQYTCGEGWKSKGKLSPQLESRQQYGTYTINDKSQKQKDILNACYGIQG